MFGFPSKEIVEKLREEYPEGTRVELVRMDDNRSRLNPGDKGTVRCVDDTGTIFVRIAATDWFCERVHMVSFTDAASFLVAGLQRVCKAQ